MEFPRASLQDWQRKLEQDLKGRRHDQLAWHTADGFAVPALATRDDLATLPHIGALGLLQARRGWHVRELITTGAPEAAAQRARRALEQGAHEVEFCLDALAHDAREPTPSDAAADDDDDDAILGWSAPGEGGVSIHSRSEFDAAVGGLDLTAQPVWFSAGEGALAVLAWHLRRADALGVPRAALRGGVDFDPVARLTMRQVRMPDDTRLISQHSDPAQVFAETARVLRDCATHCPGLRPVVVDGLVYHLAGCSPAFETGATLAALVETARGIEPHGLDFATLAAGCSLRVQVGHELLLEVAKLRALRLLWARIGAASGAGGEALLPHLLGVTSGRMRAEEFDQRTNLIRTTLASFAAVLGGCDSVITAPFDDAVDDADQATLARNQQLLLREESHLQRVADPCAGSYSVERLTDRIARRAWEVLQQIEAEGGLLATMRSGWLADHVGAQEGARERAFRDRTRVLVGINRFADLELGGPVPRPDAAAEAAADQHSAAHHRRLAQRDPTALRAYLQSLRQADSDLLEVATAAGADQATLTEIASAGWPAADVAVEHRFLPVAAGDAHEYEELRLWAQNALDDGEPLPRVAPLPLGPVRAARARADFARDVFLVGGLPVDDPGRLDSVDAAVQHLHDTGAAVAVLCSDDASHAELIDALAPRLAGTTTRLFVAGRLDAARAAPVDGCLHPGMDLVAFLDRLQNDLGLRPDDDAE